MARPKKNVAVVKTETVDIVQKKIKMFQKNGELDLPADYSSSNALKAAFLILQDTVDKNKKPVLETCTKSSIANALLNMVVQGLNPAKSQCYFIAYGSKLTLSRSYQGNKAICLRVDPALQDIYAEVIYQGDVVSYDIHLGQKNIVKHEQKFESIGGDIIGAYAVAVTKQGTAKRTELMTMAEIKTSWAQSKMSPITDKGQIKAGSVHAKFTAEMCKKTATSRLSKHIIGASSDAGLMQDVIKSAVQATNDDAALAEAEEVATEQANNGEVIDIEPEVVVGPTMLDGDKSDEYKQYANTSEDVTNSEPEKELPMTDEEKAEIVEEETGGPGF